MTFFDNLNIQWKLACCFLVLVGIFALAGGVGVLCCQKSGTDISIVAAARSLNEANIALDRDLFAIASGADQGTINMHIASVNLGRGVADKRLAQLKELQGDSEINKEVAGVVEPEKGFLSDVDSVLQSGAQRRAALAAEVAGRGRSTTIGASLESLGDKAETSANKNLSFVTESVVIGVVASVMLAFLLAHTINKSINDPLNQFQDYAKKLMEGDISASLPTTDAQDEVAEFGRTFASLGRSWTEIAVSAQRVADGDLTAILMPRSDKDIFLDAFNRMIENIAVVTVQFRDSVALMSKSAAEILTSVNDSAESASQTAAAATETSTIVEEVRQTSHVASEKAKQVSESAQTTAKISAMGRKATEDIIEGMSRIREQVDLIAEAMVALGEKSQSISGIIATVDDLAKQSNLLAVNASIEAAKAGEYGKGFGVVAREVKNMAEQSKQSTAKVRTLIAEIQQATNAAAMATELGGKTVDAALAQSQQAGESIAALAGSVVQSAQAASQIAVSTQEQLTGVDQVAMAMDSISKACSEHLSAISRVEQATNRLNDIGNKLKALVSIFDASQGNLPTASAFWNMPQV